MKKSGIVLGVLLVIAAACWWGYRAHVRKIESGVQGDPVRTVRAFMHTVLTLNTLLWDEEERERVKAAVDAWEEEGATADAPEALTQRGISSPLPLFDDERRARAAVTVFCLYRFDTFSVTDTKVGEESASVTVQFVPQDVLGLKALVAAHGGKVAEEAEKKPVVVPFQLNRRGHRWRIVKMEGEVGKAVEAMKKLRGSK